MIKIIKTFLLGERDRVDHRGVILDARGSQALFLRTVGFHLVDREMTVAVRGEEDELAIGRIAGLGVVTDVGELHRVQTGIEALAARLGGKQIATEDLISAVFFPHESKCWSIGFESGLETFQRNGNAGLKALDYVGTSAAEEIGRASCRERV